MEPSLLSTIILGAVGIIITLWYSIHSKNLAHDQMMKELFADFNRRYSQLNNSLAEIESKYPTIEKLNTAVNSFALKQAVQDYFNLCSEEFYWYYHKSRIDKIIWDSWQSGMIYWYNVPAIKDMWENEISLNGKVSYYITGKTEFFVKEK